VRAKLGLYTLEAYTDLQISKIFHKRLTPKNITALSAVQAFAVTADLYR
jgi:hypothetical protein